MWNFSLKTIKKSIFLDLKNVLFLRAGWYEVWTPDRNKGHSDWVKAFHAGRWDRIWWMLTFNLTLESLCFASGWATRRQWIGFCTGNNMSYCTQFVCWQQEQLKTETTPPAFHLPALTAPFTPCSIPALAWSRFASVSRETKEWAEWRELLFKAQSKLLSQNPNVRIKVMACREASCFL